MTSLKALSPCHILRYWRLGFKIMYFGRDVIHPRKRSEFGGASATTSHFSSSS